jgi:hypothetical protein
VNGKVDGRSRGGWGIGMTNERDGRGTRWTGEGRGRKESRIGIKREKDECIKEIFFEKLVIHIHHKVTVRPYDVLRLLLNYGAV